MVFLKFCYYNFIIVIVFLISLSVICDQIFPIAIHPTFSSPEKRKKKVSFKVLSHALNRKINLKFIENPSRSTTSNRINISFCSNSK